MARFRTGLAVIDLETEKTGIISVLTRKSACVDFPYQHEWMTAQASYMFVNHKDLRTKILPIEEWNARIKKRREKEAKRVAKTKTA